MFLFTKPSKMVMPDEALPGREAKMQVAARHDVLGTPLEPPFPEGIEHLHSLHPDVHVVCAAIDRGLNERGFIVPGLGDAGDRLYGTK